MSDLTDVFLRHVTACAIIPAGAGRHLARGSSVAAEAFGAKVGSGFRPWLNMRVVAGGTTQASVALPITLTQRHHRVMFKERGNRSARLCWRLKDRYRFVQRRTGTKIQIFLARLQYSSSGSLVAIHADVIREPTRQLGRIDDRVVKFACHRHLPASFIHV